MLTEETGKGHGELTARVQAVVEREVSERTMGLEKSIKLFRLLMPLTPIAVVAATVTVFLFTHFAQASDVQKLDIKQSEETQKRIITEEAHQQQFSVIMSELATLRQAMSDQKELIKDVAQRMGRPRDFDTAASPPLKGSAPNEDRDHQLHQR